MISSSVKFLLNDKLIVINNPDPNQTLLNYIRTELKKTGTKEGCSEGGCGACTIVLGELVDNKIIYKAINSCISFVPSLNGKQLLIVEDLVSKDGKLHPVQDAMVKFHGSQCGFCTPGFVMSLFSMFKNNKNLNNELITDSISGNLCRCTGYRPIIDAAKSLNKKDFNGWFNKLFEKSNGKAKTNGYVETFFGRRIPIRGINSKNFQERSFAERQSINAPIQGSAADIIKRAMIKIHNEFLLKKIRSKMLLQVHDELVFECPEDEVKKVSEIIKVEMEKAHLPICELNVPVIVDFGEATNWSAAH